MIRIRQAALAFIVAGPGLAAAAGVVSPIPGRIASPAAPVAGAFGTAGAFTATLQLGTLSPAFIAPALSASQSLAPSLAAPAAALAAAPAAVPAAAPAAAPEKAVPGSAGRATETGESSRVSAASPAMGELIGAAQDRPAASLEEVPDQASLDEDWRREDPRTGFGAPSAARLSAGARAVAAGFKKGDTFTIRTKDIKFEDADTITVPLRGKMTSVRFGGVDAPEIPHFGNQGQPYGKEAAAFLKKLILRGKSVTVAVEDMDQYGRVVGGLALNLPDGKTLDVQRELVRAGWAWHYIFFNHDMSLRRLQKQAMAARRGLWQGLDVGGANWPEAPWVFRRREKAEIARILPGAVFKLVVDHMPDADTIRNVKGASVYGSLRLAGVDAPETAHPGSPAQPYGDEASVRAHELLMGKTVTVTVEDTDMYGRLVAWVRFRDGAVWRDFHEVLLQEGWAWWYQKYYPEHTRLGEMEKAARAARVGLWKGVGRRDHMSPWEWREKQRKKRERRKNRVSENRVIDVRPYLASGFRGSFGRLDLGLAAQFL